MISWLAAAWEGRNKEDEANGKYKERGRLIKKDMDEEGG